MPVYKRIRRKKRQVHIGDLDTEIIINNREIVGLKSEDPNFNEAFTPTAIVWAMVETVSGVSEFDETNTEVDVTDLFYIRYDPSVTSESWVELEGNNYKILSATDLDRRQEFTLITATLRGDKTKRVNLS